MRALTCLALVLFLPTRSWSTDPDQNLGLIRANSAKIELLRENRDSLKKEIAHLKKMSKSSVYKISQIRRNSEMISELESEVRKLSDEIDSFVGLGEHGGRGKVAVAEPTSSTFSYKSVGQLKPVHMGIAFYDSYVSVDNTILNMPIKPMKENCVQIDEKRYFELYYVVRGMETESSRLRMISHLFGGVCLRSLGVFSLARLCSYDSCLVYVAKAFSSTVKDFEHWPDLLGLCSSDSCVVNISSFVRSRFLNPRVKLTYSRFCMYDDCRERVVRLREN